LKNKSFRLRCGCWKKKQWC